MTKIKTTRGRGRGRPAFGTTNKFELVAALRSIKSGENTVSYHNTRKLVELGYVKAENRKTEGQGRGRPIVDYSLTTKGNTYVNFSKNWK